MDTLISWLAKLSPENRVHVTLQFPNMAASLPDRFPLRKVEQIVMLIGPVRHPYLLRKSCPRRPLIVVILTLALFLALPC